MTASSRHRPAEHHASTATGVIGESLMMMCRGIRGIVKVAKSTWPDTYTHACVRACVQKFTRLWQQPTTTTTTQRYIGRGDKEHQKERGRNKQTKQT